MAIDQLQNDSVDKSRQQLGYSQNLTDELKKQENLAESLNQRYSNQADKLKSISEAFKSAKDEAQALSEAIKDQLEALKKTNEYSTRYAELNEKIKKAGKEFAENKQKSIDIEKKLGDINSTEATKTQKLAQQYVNGLTARYKIDEKINELTEKRLAYDDVRRTGTDPQKIEAARKEYLNAGLVVRELKKQMEAVNQINTGKGQLLKNLSQEEIAQLLFIIVVQQNPQNS